MAIGKATGALLAAIICSRATILPIEVVGEAGAASSVTLALPANSVKQVRSLWFQIHGLGFAGMASIRINRCTWIPLTNESATIAEPGRSYGGIGGGFATLQMTLPLDPETMLPGPNTVEFRFNRSNGVVSGFRVLALNFLSADGHKIVPPEAFTQEDPKSWTPPLPDAANLETGKRLWHTAQLVANSSASALPIRAHCADCHTADGRDLKYFNFSNASIAARSRFHGLTELEGQQIASYIRSLPLPNPGRPWNPPYQPGPGLDEQTPANWAAGAGLKWVLDSDLETLPYIAPSAFLPDANLNLRGVPIAMQLPDWNHWLPRVHPLDAWPTRFEAGDFSRLYRTAAPDGSATFFEKWAKARSKLLTHWSPALTEAFYSAQLWQLVKTWEIMQESGLEQARCWPNTIPAGTAPDAVNIPDGPYGMGGSALTNEYFSNAWYEVQMLLNNGNHRRHDRAPIDWTYSIQKFLLLQRESQTPEPARLLIALIKSTQSSDPKIGPENIAEGWRPDDNIDPRIMVSTEWAPVFQTVPIETRRKITELLLTVWLEKTSQYHPAAYFHRGLSQDYAAPAQVRGIYGGRVWEDAAQFQALGINPSLIQRIQAWGREYTDAAARFQYSQ
jgi:hypothetical protein